MFVLGKPIGLGIPVYFVPNGTIVLIKKLGGIIVLSGIFYDHGGAECNIHFCFQLGGYEKSEFCLYCSLRLVWQPVPYLPYQPIVR